MRLRKILALVMLALIVFPSIGVVMGATFLMVSTDSKSYEPGEKVEIYGTADSNATVTIVIVNNSTLEKIYEGIIEADQDGEFSVSFNLSEEATDGFYNVTASNDGIEAEASFVVMGDEPEQEEPEEIETSVEEENTTQLEFMSEGNDGEDGDDVERALGLKVAVERAFIFIGKVNSSADRLEEAGYIIDPTVRERLLEANSSLTTLMESLDFVEITPEEAAQELARIREFLGQTMGLLHSTAVKEANMDRAERFFEQTQNRVQGLDNAISKLQERLGVANAEKAREALGKVVDKLIEIRDRLAEGDVEGAVNDLDSVVGDINVTLDQLNDEDASNMLKAMNRIQAQIRVLNVTAERMAMRGEDTSPIEEELQNAETLLDQMTNQLEGMSTNEAMDLLGEAEDSLQNIGKMIRSFRKNGGNR